MKHSYRHMVTDRLVPPQCEVLVPFAEEEVRAAARALKAAGITAIAIGFLFSFLNPAHERRACEIVLEEHPDAFVTISSDVAPQLREFERFTTTAMNGFVGPKVRESVACLDLRLADAGLTAGLHIMASNGGLVTPTKPAEQPVVTKLSGPAAGVLGGAWAGALSGKRNLIIFEVGGTSADIGIVTDGALSEATARDTWIAGFPLLTPTIDIHTIGAGGGSIAQVDEGVAFRVGQQSAGARPGPVACGRGGTEPTVTDVHVVLGRLVPEHVLAGAMSLDVVASERGIDRRASDLKYDVLRTACQISIAFDLARIVEDFAEIEEEIAARFAADGIAAGVTRFVQTTVMPFRKRLWRSLISASAASASGRSRVAPAPQRAARRTQRGCAPPRSCSRASARRSAQTRLYSRTSAGRSGCRSLARPLSCRRIRPPQCRQAARSSPTTAAASSSRSEADMDTQVHPTIDPITASVVQGAFENIAVEIGDELMRMA